MPYADPATQREYQRRWLADRRAEWFAEHGPCVVCGTWEALEVHHRDPAKKVSHHVWSWSAERRLAELAKCEVRCRDHHIDHHRKPVRHGTLTGYKHHQCRCAECRSANADHVRGARGS